MAGALAKRYDGFPPGGLKAACSANTYPAVVFCSGFRVGVDRRQLASKLLAASILKISSVTSPTNLLQSD
ncbi:MAG: hypothetical protein AAAB20_21895 [Rhizobium sp.]|jgi:hypothetical protein|uniref:hypothetical protein n=1 Tax=Rhizobium sp. TaxID=391 RepID=UPI000AFD9A46